jgi:hypothetical protein
MDTPNNPPISDQKTGSKFLSRKNLDVLIIGSLIVALAILLVKNYLPKPAATAIPVNAALNATVTLPADAVRISGCIAHEGEHWVQKDKLHTGPFYVTYNSKVVGIEYMFKESDIPGKNFAYSSPVEAMEYLQSNHLSLSGLVHSLETEFDVPQMLVKDWTFHWTPPHAGLVEPHIDVHFFLVDKAERETICPDATFEEILPADLYQDLKNRGVEVPE